MQLTKAKLLLLSLGCLGALCSHPGHAAEYRLFDRTNLMAWCIVPFDAKKRGPEERAAMLENLGFKLFAYDYRAEHIPTFDAEMEALKRHGVRLLAWWFPGVMNEEATNILAVMKRHNVKNAQLWVTGGGEPVRSPEEQKARVAAEATRIKTIAVEAAKLGHSVALYNHMNWFGEPENQLEIIAALRTQGITNVGIVYNLHHGHDHLDRLPELLQKMKPHLLAFNLNGMVRDGEKSGKKILPVGKGDLDARVLRMLRDSGWRGPVGILNHTDEDAETRLQENLLGLEKLCREAELEPGEPAVEESQEAGIFIPAAISGTRKMVAGGRHHCPLLALLKARPSRASCSSRNPVATAGSQHSC